MEFGAKTRPSLSGRSGLLSVAPTSLKGFEHYRADFRISGSALRDRGLSRMIGRPLSFFGLCGIFSEATASGWIDAGGASACVELSIIIMMMVRCGVTK